MRTLLRTWPAYSTVALCSAMTLTAAQGVVFETSVRRHFDQGAPWTFVVQNKAPHCCIMNAKALILQ